MVMCIKIRIYTQNNLSFYFWLDVIARGYFAVTCLMLLQVMTYVGC
jgi:hypothetical protein